VNLTPDDMDDSDGIEAEPVGVETAPFRTSDGRVFWVPVAQIPFLQEWDWKFDQDRLEGYREDAEFGPIYIANQIVANEAIRNPEEEKTYCILKTFQLYEQFGNHPNYVTYLQDFAYMRVLMSEKFSIQCPDAHTLLGRLYATLQGEYLQWFAARTYIGGTPNAPVRLSLAPRFSSLLQWAMNMLEEKDQQYVFVLDGVRDSLLSTWRDCLQAMEQDVPAADLESYLTTKGVSSARILTMATAMLWAAPCPPVTA
jgi:hypothetical protein